MEIRGKEKVFLEIMKQSCYIISRKDATDSDGWPDTNVKL